MREPVLTIGRRDVIDLPDFGIKNISAKVDTGAYTGALNSQDIKIIPGNPDKLSFTIVGVDYDNRQVITEDFTQGLVRNSFGAIEKRYIIRTSVTIFNKIIPAEFSLSDRSSMRHPILLGRKFLRGRFIVDVSKFNLSYEQKLKSEK